MAFEGEVLVAPSGGPSCAAAQTPELTFVCDSSSDQPLLVAVFVTATFPKVLPLDTLRSKPSARMRDAFPAFVRHLLADHHAPRTVKTYGAILTSFASSHCGSNAPNRTMVEIFLARPRRDGRPRASSTRNQELAALRSFATFAKRELNWQTDPTEGIEFVVEPPHDPDVLTEQELQQFFETAAKISRRGERPRNLALLAVLSQVGLRIHEAVGLNVGQVDLASATLVGVHGKGDTVHCLPLNVPAVALLGALVAERGVCERESPLFLSQRGARLSIRAAESFIARLRVRMGSPKKITPHTLRHTAATLTLMAGTDLSTVAELLRHRNVNTTRRYLHLVDTRRREAVRRLEGTVPTTILPAANSTTPSMPQAPEMTLPKPPESSVFRRSIDLDDQQGLVAQSRPNTATNINETRFSSGARCRFLTARCAVEVVGEAP